MTSGTARRVSTWNNGLLVVSEMMNDFRLSRISCKYTPNVFNFVHHFANRNREETAFKERYTYYGKASLKSIIHQGRINKCGGPFRKTLWGLPRRSKWTKEAGTDRGYCVEDFQFPVRVVPLHPRRLSSVRVHNKTLDLRQKRANCLILRSYHLDVFLLLPFDVTEKLLDAQRRDITLIS